MMFDRLSEDGSGGGGMDYDMPIFQDVQPIESPTPIAPVVQSIEPVNAFNTSLSETPIEVPEPTVSYPSNWEYAAAAQEPVSYESDLPWHSVPAETPSQDPTYVFSQDEQPVYSPPTNYPFEPSPAYTYQQPLTYEQKYPIESPPFNPGDYEVPKMEAAPYEPIYVRGIDMMPIYGDDGYLTYEQKYPIESPPFNPGPAEPIPIIPGPIYTALPVVPVDVPVQTLPPTVNVGAQTPTTQQVVPDGETAMIFGFPWYYVAGAAAAALFLFSSDGKK